MDISIKTSDLVFNKIADSRQMISWDLINGGSLQYQAASNNIRLKKKIQQNRPTFYDIDSFVRRQLHFRVICSSWEKSNPIPRFLTVWRM